MENSILYYLDCIRRRKDEIRYLENRLRELGYKGLI